MSTIYDTLLVEFST